MEIKIASKYFLIIKKNIEKKKIASKRGKNPPNVKCMDTCLQKLP